MATPHVSGVAALVWSLDPGLSAQEVKETLLNTVDPIPALNGKTVSGGRLNAFNAVNAVAPGVDLIGTEDDDVLTGTQRGDIIKGLGGDDVIEGLGGNDQIAGGDGNDFISAGNGKDTVTGDEGDDYIASGDGDDTIAGNEGQDAILGGNGNDSLSGGADKDRILGEAGDDTILGDAGSDVLTGGEDNDFVFGGTENDNLFGNSGNDNLAGDDGNDQLTGGLGSDFLDGGASKDTLIGVDPLVAGSGFGFGAGEVDNLLGGSGWDTFVLGDANHVYYSDGDPLTTGEADYALIADFNDSEDVIQLQGSAVLYSLDFFTSSTGTIDAALIYDPGVTARGEVTGILQNVSPSLSLTSSAFSFI